jgi:hypothetical protein
MAARLNRRHQDLVRDKIQISNILHVLHEHVEGKRELTSAQVASAKLLLDKSLSNAPDVSEIDLTMGGKIEVEFV